MQGDAYVPGDVTATRTTVIVRVARNAHNFDVPARYFRPEPANESGNRFMPLKSLLGAC
jgi:hypothetical protein